MRLLTLSFLWIISLQALGADMCSSGQTQSPVNIDHAFAKSLPPLNFGSYQTVNMHILNDLPTNFYASPDKNIVLEIDTVRYPLTNIHLHSPSEHRINGNQFPLEIHFVHTSLEGNQIILAQFAVIGKNNPILGTLLNSFATDNKFGLNPKDLIASFHGYYRYQGSETYPPCLENVTWYVLKDMIEIGNSQVEAFRHLAGENSRVPQPMNGRSVYVKE